jgi:SAM-dependent methyltransferase
MSLSTAIPLYEQDDQARRYDPTNLHSDGTLRGLVLDRLLSAQGIHLTRGHLLDLGCGYGGLSIYAAQQGATVTSIDTSPYKLEILKGRVLNEGAGSRLPISIESGNATSLPLESDTVDTVVTMGVIEWVPLTTPGRDPEAIQRSALREIARVLKPGGMYVLGTKNRWYPGNLYHEPQVGWPLINHLPRPLARSASQVFWKRDYRTYVHSLGAWRTMLLRSGFRSVRVFLPVFFYQFPLALWAVGADSYDLDEALEDAASWIPEEYIRSVCRSYPLWKRRFLKGVLRTHLERILWPSLVLVASK